MSDTCEVWPPSAPNVGTCNRDKKKLTQHQFTAGGGIGSGQNVPRSSVYLGIVFEGVNRILFAVAVRKI